jgi:uncharacterized protein
VDLRAVREILERHGDSFIRAWVYGSVARGDQDEESDVDLVLVRRTRAGFFDRIREIMGLVRELGPADILIYTPEEIAELTEVRKSGFLQDVVSRGVMIEGSQERGRAVAPAIGE